MAAEESSLLLRAREGVGKPIRLGRKPVTIGRHPENLIKIVDQRSSRYHCVIEKVREGEIWIRDLESRNGTKVNGDLIREVPLKAGDLISIGTTEFVVEAAKAKPKPKPESNGHSGATIDVEGSAEPGWALELKRMYTGLPPKTNEYPRISLIDARGQDSVALEGQGDGSRAFLLCLQVAFRGGASDIHFEPKRESVHVRIRVDGQMVWIAELPVRVGELVLGLVKTAAQVKQTHGEAVLDGHFSCRMPGKRVEFRVSFTPSMHGQKLVLRILDETGAPSKLSSLGMPRYMLDRIREVCRQDAGMLLVCGPTGSGKTTTLYNGLREIDRESKNVITIEDPVEYHLEGVTQMPIDEQRGNTFNALLRSVLRQDPDVILLGEIRDEETASTAMRAAMTGHLVFSTVHAKDSISSVFRLLDLKVEPFLVANSLQLVLAQRLIRTLCDECKRAVPIKPGQATRMGRFVQGRSAAYVPVGCAACLGTGFRGRRAVFELLDVNEELRDVILSEPSIQAMRKVIEQGLFTTLQQSGWRLVADGSTSIDEVDKVAGTGS